jgi:hypothetical protein
LSIGDREFACAVSCQPGIPEVAVRWKLHMPTKPEDFPEPSGEVA